MKKVMVVLVFVITALGINSYQSNKKRKAIEQQKYDFRNEKYQDFYSKLRRSLAKKDENGKIPSKKFKQVDDTGFDFSFDYKKVAKLLNLKNVPETVHGKIVITRVKPENSKLFNNSYPKTKKEIIEHYKNHKNYPIEYDNCPPNQEIEGLICLQEKNSNLANYYLMPNQPKKNDYSNKKISMNCHIHIKPITKQDCRLLSLTDKPYNLDIWVDFNNPNNFFYVIQYVEAYIFNATGEHIWQTSHKQTTQGVSK